MDFERWFPEVPKGNGFPYEGIECDLDITQSQRPAWLAFTNIMNEVSLGFEELNHKITEPGGDQRPSFVEACDFFAHRKWIEAAMAHQLFMGAKSLYPVLSYRQRLYLDLFLRSHPAFLNVFKF